METSDFNYTDELQVVIDSSYDETERLNGKIVTADCLMLGILKAEKSIAFDLLQKMDFNVSFFKKIVETEQKEIFDKLAQAESRAHIISMNENAKEILKNVIVEAIKYKSEVVNSFHLLCAILKCEESNAGQILNELEINEHQIQIIYFAKQPYKVDFLLDSIFCEFNYRKNNLLRHSEIPSGFTELDEKLHGWKPSQLVVVGGRPCMGKTTFVNHIARNASLDYQVPTAIFSLDLTKELLLCRLIAIETEIHRNKIISLDFDEDEWLHIQNKISGLYKAPIFIDDTQNLGIQEFKFKAKELVEAKCVRLIVLDDLQLMKSGKKGTMKELKTIATKLNVAIIATTQLSKSVEKREGNNYPLSIDLEKPADKLEYIDTLIFLYRPEYYGIEIDEYGMSTKGLTEVIIQKNNFGITNTFRLNFLMQSQKFTDWIE